MAVIELDFNDNIVNELEVMCNEIGMNMASFFLVYVRNALRERRIPFCIDVVENDSLNCFTNDKTVQEKTYDEYFEKFVIPTHRGKIIDKGFRADGRI